MSEDNFLYYVYTLNSLFETGFIGAYKNANPRKRRRILPYLQAIYRRWYYSVLIENTPFSPANLMESICRHFNEPVSCIIPTLRTPTKVTGVGFNVQTYTPDNHPIIDDLKKLIDYCSPHVDLCEEGGFTDEQSLELAKSLSLNDPHYASFLMEVALWMKLLTKMPSLYINRMQISKICGDTMNLPNKELLQKIIDATISLSAFGLHNSIPMPEHIFTESFVRGLLTDPMETDDIFARVFDVMGYDLEDLMDVANMPPPDEMDMDMDLESLGLDMEILSGTFVLGIMLDRFFFTPFGHFLRLIRPLYVLPFDFSSEIGEYTNVCEDPEEAFVAFFAPCSSYSLTDLGLAVLDVKPNDDNYLNVNEHIPFESMKDTIFAAPETIAIFVEMARQLSPLILGEGAFSQIYTFRVRREDDNSAWIHLQFPENTTLHHLYEEIAHFFGLNLNDDYSFFHDKTENRFAEYVTPKKSKPGGRKKKTADTLLSELDFHHMQHMILTTYNQATPFTKAPPTIRLNIERLKESEPEPGEMYPKASRISASLKRLLEE